MNEIDYFIVFILYSGNVIANIDHLHVKKIDLMSFSYIVREDDAMRQGRDTTDMWV
jgi:hypothetical protein